MGREWVYHGVNLGGIAVGGIANNCKFFSGLIPGVDHLSHTHNLEHNAFSRGQPQWGEELASNNSSMDTYSGHPVACAAGLATLDIYES